MMHLTPLILLILESSLRFSTQFCNLLRKSAKPFCSPVLNRVASAFIIISCENYQTCDSWYKNSFYIFNIESFECLAIFNINVPVIQATRMYSMYHICISRIRWSTSLILRSSDIFVYKKKNTRDVKENFFTEATKHKRTSIVWH